MCPRLFVRDMSEKFASSEKCGGGRDERESRRGDEGQKKLEASRQGERKEGRCLMGRDIRIQAQVVAMGGKTRVQSTESRKTDYGKTDYGKSHTNK